MILKSEYTYRSFIGFGEGAPIPRPDIRSCERNDHSEWSKLTTTRVMDNSPCETNESSIFDGKAGTIESANFRVQHRPTITQTIRALLYSGRQDHDNNMF